MSLTKQDLKEIKNLIDQSADSTMEKTRLMIDQSTDLTLEKTRLMIDQSAEEVTSNLSDKVDAVKKQILNEVGQEISDLADINRAVITRTDQIDHRLRIVERKLGLIVK